jgi:hypothetical protein
MRSLHLEKNGIRGLAIAESFRQDSKKSILSGVIMSNDFVIDGFVFGNSTLKGDDATEEIISMYNKVERPDISYILISGVVISLYNIIDIKKLHDILQIPIIGVTYKESDGLEETIKKHFPDDYKEKLEKYSMLGTREKISLDTSFDLYVRNEGCTTLESKQLLNKITLQGSVPEPLRVAQLLAKTMLN